ncbi:MAG: hypothetical protein ACJ73D_00265, partial [Pyrinomonadaceae bacterium]
AKLRSAAMPGTAAADLYEVARHAYSRVGFENEIDQHHQGGACGYRTRDWLLCPSSSEVVRPSQAFAFNQSVAGTKVEVTGISTEQGLVDLSPAQGFPTIVTTIDGVEYISPGILSLTRGAAA